ncbi:MAG TPA: 2OG-Fe(II) oxygenase family protein [Bdellovibrionota bacterium]|nr:2OG-Fe(II) oxygenase family protein [Bdellovibrionota bacterium]
MNVKTVRYGAPGAAREFKQSLLETGFAVLTDHPIPAQLIRDTFSEWERWFAAEEKHSHVYEAKSQAGYFPFRSENAKDYRVKDLKEFYHHYPARKPLPNGVTRYTPDLYSRLVSLGSELLQWIEDETPEEVRSRFPLHLTEMIEGSDENLLRILHYPPLSGDEEEGAVRAAAHEDINLITLLPAATAPGLEVKDTQGRWHAVACDPGMIVINSGDMLKETSRGYYPSTTHRVVNPTGPEARKARYSMPLFVHPRPDAALTESRTAGDFLHERLREIGLLPKQK